MSAASLRRLFPNHFLKSFVKVIVVAMPQYTTRLSIMDEMMPAVHTAMWLTVPCADTETTLSALQAGLSRTIEQLPFLAGMVYEDSKDCDRSSMIWNTDNLSMTWEEVDGRGLPSYQQLAKQNMPLHDLEHDFLPSAIKQSTTQTMKPALIASYTKIEGGLILLLAPHHHVMDGGGRQLLFDLWARYTPVIAPGPTTMPVETPIRADEPFMRSHRLQEALLKATGSPRGDASPTLSSAGVSPAISAFSQSKSQLPPSASVPASVTRRLFRFNITELSALRSSIQSHTASPEFSLNTLLAALIWQTVSEIRFGRFVRTEPALESEITSLTAELVMAVDPRRWFEAQGLLDKEVPWLGNLATAITPKPCLPFSELAIAQGRLLHLDLGQDGSIPINPVLPTVIDTLTRGISEMTPANIAKYLLDTEHRIAGEIAKPDANFSYRSLRDMSHLFNGLTLTVTAWSNFNYYPYFGPNVGRPEFVRIANTYSFDGVVVLLPRKRAADGWTAEEVDVMEVFMCLREDDMKVFEENETILKLLVDDARRD